MFHWVLNVPLLLRIGDEKILLSFLQEFFQNATKFNVKVYHLYQVFQSKTVRVHCIKNEVFHQGFLQ